MPSPGKGRPCRAICLSQEAMSFTLHFYSFLLSLVSFWHSLTSRWEITLHYIRPHTQHSQNIWTKQLMRPNTGVPWLGLGGSGSHLLSCLEISSIESSRNFSPVTSILTSENKLVWGCLSYFPGLFAGKSKRTAFGRDLRVVTLVWLLLQIWPSYKWDNSHHWPELKTLDFNYLNWSI